MSQHLIQQGEDPKQPKPRSGVLRIIGTVAAATYAGVMYAAAPFMREVLQNWGLGTAVAACLVFLGLLIIVTLAAMVAFILYLVIKESRIIQQIVDQFLVNKKKGLEREGEKAMRQPLSSQEEDLQSLPSQAASVPATKPGEDKPGGNKKPHNPPHRFSGPILLPSGDQVNGKGKSSSPSRSSRQWWLS